METRLEGIHYKTQKPIQLILEGERITKVLESDSRLESIFLAPGLVDLQVNGFQGIDFNEEKLSEEDAITITTHLWQVGVTSYMPTLITGSDQKISKAIKTIVNACSRNVLVDQSILGIHLEGPFISKEEGPRGAHPLEFVQSPNWDLFKSWQEIAEGRIKLITLSPEWDDAVDFIERCAESGVKVAIGHTAANSLQIEAAVKAGASLSTHLGNAAHLMLPRHPNYIWDQLAAEELWTSLIGDGFHLPTSVLKVFMKVKPNKTFLISDSTKFAGLPPGNYSSPIGGEIQLSPSGRLFMRHNPALLAGSASTLLHGINFLIQNDLARPDEAIEMASVKPREYMTGAAKSTLTKGEKADFLVYEKKGSEIKLLQTIKSGKLVYSV